MANVNTVNNNNSNSNNIISNSTDSIRLVSYNMHGFNQGHSAVDEMTTNDNIDVFLLQEHWLTPGNLHKFDVKFDNYFTFGSSAMALSLIHI